MMAVRAFVGLSGVWTLRRAGGAGMPAGGNGGRRWLRPVPPVPSYIY